MLHKRFHHQKIDQIILTITLNSNKDIRKTLTSPSLWEDGKILNITYTFDTVRRADEREKTKQTILMDKAAILYR